MIKMLAHNVFISNTLTLPGLAASYRQRWHRLSLICTQGKLSGEDTHLLMKPSSCYFLFLSSCFTCFSPPSSGTGERAREQRSTKWSNKKTRLGWRGGWVVMSPWGPKFRSQCLCDEQDKHMQLQVQESRCLHLASAHTLAHTHVCTHMHIHTK